MLTREALNKFADLGGLVQRFPRALAVLVLALLPGLAAAACPPHRFADPAGIRLAGDSVLIVTHATSTHDARFSTKRGVDEAVRFAKSKRIPVVFLQDDSPGQFYFMEDCDPDYWVYSEDGGIAFDVPPTHVYLAGGHLELCLSRTVHDVLLRWARQPKHSLTVTYLMDAIYTNGKLVEESDPFYGDFQRFMGVVTYGRPQGEHWPKLTLLETMGVIIREDHELEYLKKAVPHHARTLPPDFQVELRLNESVVKVLRAAPGWRPPTLRFHFVNSALDLAGP